MPDEEIAEEGLLTPTEPAIQDPLLRELLAENETAPSGFTQESAQPLPPSTEAVDCIVIGLGAGGAPLLARLAQAGLKVVALEAGPWHNPEKDFATDERAQDFLFWNDERLAAGGDPLAMGKNNSGTGVGGSTLHYTAYTPRPLPDDLHIKSDFGVGEDWPLAYDDLAPYFAEVERFIGVSGPTPYPWGPARPTGYPMAPLPLNSAAQLMVRGAEKVGIQTSPAPNAALSARYFQEGVGWREACTNRGFCQAGCSNGAKSSMDVTFIPLAVKYGADIRPNSYVTEIERNARGHVSAVVYTQNGQTHRLACKNLFLCGGSVETPRILLLNELALTSGQVGRNLMAHPGLQVWGTFPEEVRPNKGIPGGLISQDTHRPKDADFVGGYLLQSIGVMPVTFSGQVARGRKLWGQPLRDYMRQFNHIAGINILGDCLPHADNYLELSEEQDARQLPKPRLHFTAQENEHRMNAHAEKMMRAIWEAAGATDIWAFQRYAHVIGTARMGLSGDDAVVDRDGRAFDVPNLYICDNSVFPSALSVNPALTIMALSLRTADKFLERETRRDA
ncbi:MAG: GMC family oxidoreductase [Janthinobacterium lividum]